MNQPLMQSVMPHRREGYAVVLVCSEIDGFSHNAVFAQEIVAALAACGQDSRVLDYRKEPRALQAALLDSACAFMICFNGFGSELGLANYSPGQHYSAFTYYKKPLFDLMHDCPSHESMSHQIPIRDPIRHLMITDYGYLQEAQELGISNIRFVPSITFPHTLQTASLPPADRPIKVLLPVQLPPPDTVEQRYAGGGGYRLRVFREIYEAVAQACIADLRLDPRVETRKACREAGVLFTANDADCRFLLTSIADKVKFSRRRDLIKALAGLPVTLITSLADPSDLPAGMSVAPARSFQELLCTMAMSKCVICPLPHHTGHHERALGALTAGAAVLAAPNAILETEFRIGRDLTMYSSLDDVATKVMDLLSDASGLEALAQSGHERAMEVFSPRRFVETIFSILSKEN